MYLTEVEPQANKTSFIKGLISYCVAACVDDDDDNVTLCTVFQLCDP